MADQIRHFRFSRDDAAAAAGFFLYCAIFAVVRLSASPVMELDEAEQFLVAAYSWHNSNQPPLFTWILRGLFSAFGPDGAALIAVKYFFIFLFYTTFYLTVRLFWNSRQSLIVTGALVFFLIYSYDFPRQVTHSILVSIFSVLAYFVYFRMLDDTRKWTDYAFFGVVCGLGMLSKYTFLIFLSALLPGSLSCRTGRKVFIDKRICIAAAICLIIVGPHFFVMLSDGFPAVIHALERTGAGEADMLAAKGFLHLVKACFLPVIQFCAVFLLFIHRRDAINKDTRDDRIRILRWIAFYGAVVPFIAALGLQSVRFSERWLAPVLFTMPIALFSTVDFERRPARASLFGTICAITAVFILLFRMTAGFFPDQVGKVERIHIPFQKLSLDLEKELREEGISDLKQVTISSNGWHITANLAAMMPGIGTAALGKGGPVHTPGSMRNVIVWKAAQTGDIPAALRKITADADVSWLKEPYLHSYKFPPYILGAAFLRENRSMVEPSYKKDHNKS